MSFQALLHAYQEYHLTFELMTSQMEQSVWPLRALKCALRSQRVNICGFCQSKNTILVIIRGCFGFIGAALRAQNEESEELDMDQEDQDDEEDPEEVSSGEEEKGNPTEKPKKKGSKSVRGVLEYVASSTNTIIVRQR